MRQKECWLLKVNDTRGILLVLHRWCLVRGRFERWDLGKLLDDHCRMNTTHGTGPINLLVNGVTDIFHGPPGLTNITMICHMYYGSRPPLNTNLLVRSRSFLGRPSMRALFNIPMPIHNGTMEVVLILPLALAHDARSYSHTYDFIYRLPPRMINELWFNRNVRPKKHHVKKIPHDFFHTKQAIDEVDHS